MLEALFSKKAMLLHLTASKSQPFEVNFFNEVFNSSLLLCAALELINVCSTEHFFQNFKNVLQKFYKFNKINETTILKITAGKN